MVSLDAGYQMLASTARWTAAVRANENARADCLFTDPWAEALAGEDGVAWMASRSPESVVPIVVRTRYFDDFLHRVTRDRDLRQIVLVGAGLDTRPFRMTWPVETRIFELDQSVVLTYKDRVLAAAGAVSTCERVVVAADLTIPWRDRLLAAGYDSQQPTAWLLEGFLFYLPDAIITQILDEVTQLAAPGSWLGFDIINAITLTFPLTRAWVEMQARSGAPWIGTMDDPVGFLAARGWEATLSQGGAPDANYGRWVLPVIPPTMPNLPHNWFVTARRK